VESLNLKFRLTSNGSEFVDKRNSIYGKSFIGVSQEEADRFRQNFVVYDKDLESQLKNNRAKDIYDQLQDLVQLQGEIGEIIVGAKDKIGKAEANIDKADKEITLANQELRKALSYESDRKYRKIKAGSTAIGGAIGIIGGPIGIGLGLAGGWLVGKLINTAGKKKEAQQLAYLDENLKIANGED
jgi:hypothetical protein